MKLYKLIFHNKGLGGEDIIVNPKDFPHVRKGDILEIYHPEDECSRLLLQITTFKEGRDSISIEQTVAAAFQLKLYAEVYVNVVEPKSVALDSVELTFKDHYLGRSEMWRLKKNLVDKCVYVNKKIEFCGGSARCQVYEMWAVGERVTCGVITDSTKVVFRSSTSMVYLFLQMSSEMWDFDIHGDLYFEKAVNGFMADLFQKWKKHGSNHEVTIVLFSRTFYKASNLEEFPTYMRECLQLDYKGRFYEDFYRVVVQNEKYDDWNHVLVELRRLFSDYQTTVLHYHARNNVSVPKAINSTAAQGNFLEVLNMAMNVFEKHYIDRSFDRTGQLSVVITPGVGVFEVDRELTNVTKQRIIDNGVGSDLVCLGEQPLHAVPLLKFHNKDNVTADDYSMPHWINLSFYTSNKRVSYSNFIPRIKLPPRVLKTSQTTTSTTTMRNKTLYEEDEPFANCSVDYNSYDAQVFALPSVHNTRNSRALKKTSVSALETGTKIIRRKLSDPDIHHDSFSSSLIYSRSAAISIPNKLMSEDPSSLQNTSVFSNESLKGRVLEGLNPIADSCSPPPCRIGSSPTSPFSCALKEQQLPRPGRALINPFDPSHITIKLTSNRRRWAHIFPKGPSGLLIQQHHHYQGSVCSTNGSSPSSEGAFKKPSAASQMSASKISIEQVKNKPRSSILTLAGQSQPINRKSLVLLWGCTGEQEWTPSLTTTAASQVLIGVDWKSLTVPACLPITTDYFPDDVCLCTDYVFSDYNLLPDDVNAESAQLRVIYRKPLTTEEVFQELVSQRLSQGFQIIIEGSYGQTPGAGQGSVVVAPRSSEAPNVIEYKLSIGRIFHRLALSGSEIRVTRYRPRHPYPPFNFHYWYRFQAPDHDNYSLSWVSFTTEKLENFNWNYLDHYICTRGDSDFTLVETLKYWRFRVYILPISHTTKKILDGADHCNHYQHLTHQEKINLSENFLRFIETWINRMKRPPNQKKPRLDLSGFNAPNPLNRRRHSTGIISLKTSLVGNNSPFRERLGSNRLPEKPRPRSGSKGMERGRVSPADITLPLTDMDHTEFDFDMSPFIMLKENASSAEIVDAMKHTSSGVGFLSPHPTFPSLTFVSSDAVQWLINHVEGSISYLQAVVIMERLKDERHICHASGDFSQKFIVGFYLYYFVKASKEEKGGEPLGDLQCFENEWMEVEILQPGEVTPLPAFLCETLPTSCLQHFHKGPMYKEAHVEIDVQSKSDRAEWGHCKYQCVYQADKAYEMVVQWIAASGPIVSELVFGWARKAQTCGLQMIPVPADPFAYSDSPKSDPLRGPVFIPLDVECLMGTKSYLFEEFDEDSWAQRLVLLQEEIASSFGFISCPIENTHQYIQYIHLSGNVFLRIPCVPCEHSQNVVASRSRPARRVSINSESLPQTPRQEFITQHVSSQVQNMETGIGFLWAWNHIVSRRWRQGSSNATCDEAFQNKLLADFREFCTNTDNRLKNFWESSWDKMKEKGS